MEIPEFEPYTPPYPVLTTDLAPRRDDLDRLPNIQAKIKLLETWVADFKQPIDKAHLLYTLSTFQQITEELLEARCSLRLSQEQGLLFPKDSADLRKRHEARCLARELSLVSDMERDYYHTFQLISKLVALSSNLDLLSSEEIAVLIVNFFQAYPYLAPSEKLESLKNTFEQELGNNRISPPRWLEIQVARLQASGANLEELKSVENDLTGFQANDEENQQILRTTRRNCAREILLALPLSEEYAEERRRRIRQLDQIIEDEPRNRFTIEDEGLVLMEEAEQIRDPKTMHQAETALEKAGSDFHLARLKIKAYNLFGEHYFLSKSAKDTHQLEESVKPSDVGLMKSWLEIERRIGQPLIEVLQGIMDDPVPVQDATKTTLEALEDFQAGDSFDHEKLLQFIKDHPGLAQTSKELFLSLIKRFHTPNQPSALEYIKVILKKAFLLQRQVIADQELNEINQLINEHLEDPASQTEIGAVTRPTIHDSPDNSADPLVEECHKSQSIKVEDWVKRNEKSYAQKIAIPTGKSVIVVYKKGEKKLDQKQIRSLAKSFLPQPTSDATSAEKFFLKPTPQLKIMTDEQTEEIVIDGKSLRQIIEEVHYSEAGVDTIPDGIKEWLILFDKPSGLPIGFLSLNEVTVDNYAFKIELLPTEHQACESYLNQRRRDQTGESDYIGLDKLVEVTNMGICGREFSHEILATILLETGKRGQELTDTDWSIATFQSMLSRVYKKFGMNFFTLNDAKKIPLETIMTRISESGNYDPAREKNWIERGRGTRGYLVNLIPKSNDYTLQNLAESLKK